MSQQATTPSRLKASSSKLKDSPTPPKPSNSRAKSLLSADVNHNHNSIKVRRPLGGSKQPKSAEQSEEAPLPPLGSQKGGGLGRRELEESKAVVRRHPVAVEQFARPRRHQRSASVMDPTTPKKIEHDPPSQLHRISNKKKSNSEQELQEKLEMSQSFIRNLESEMLSLKAELDKARAFNLELQSHNDKLTRDLAAAEAKVQALSSRDPRESIGDDQTPKFKDIQKLIANRLDRSVVKHEAINGANNIKRPSPSLPPSPPPPPPTPPPAGDRSSKDTNLDRKDQALPSRLPPLPPPPPPPLQSSARPTTNLKAPTLVQFYHSLTKQEGNKDSTGSRNHYHKPAAVSAHNSIVGEIQNRSAHLLAIKSDIETKGQFIHGLIEKVLAAAYTDIEDVVKFVDWLDGELSLLGGTGGEDSHLVTLFSLYKGFLAIGFNLSFTLGRLYYLADERAVLKHFKWPERKADALREAAIEYRELKLLEKEISSFKDDMDIPCAAALKKMGSLLDKIPTEWMLDSGIVSEIKQASMNLAKMYMKRVTLEIESIQNSDREYSQESLLLQGVKFAYRAHQFAGGLDSETLCAFEEIRQRFPGQLGGSRELLAGIPSS
ncbi:hypothetical protein FEM48_Zijuj12G0211400 [Ziziphus jujuba var. spinosa]|uniref:Protein CHUP1, chloroplastic n=1 Tax=Ziziphus jujuba var. spinosa TaxID=714518 RepID=A0A978UFK0_ZIZJJ|nr:hypothetical protein FEM48_Zijuj12G0211400 [Ziziphus jujuba var. spinosa]